MCGIFMCISMFVYLYKKYYTTLHTFNDPIANYR